MKEVLFIVAFLIGSISIYAQQLSKKGPHEGDIFSLDDFHIEMVKEIYRCLLHPEIVREKNDICIKDGAKLERDKKIEFYLLNEDFKELELSNLEGRVRIVFKDGTATSKKIRIDNNVIWIPLSNNGHNEFQQAIVKIKLNDEKYTATFGHPIIHKGHHH